MATSDSTPKTIEIQLTKGFVAIVDECDADLAQYKWYASSRNPDVAYAARQWWVGNNRNISESMHRAILQRVLGRPLVKGEVVDHINHNPRDNRRANLRLATVAENGRNRKHMRTSTSKYKGVRKAYQGKWNASIVVNQEAINLGYYSSPEEAYAAYCISARVHFGEFAYLPDSDKVAHIVPVRLGNALQNEANRRGQTVIEMIEGLMTKYGGTVGRVATDIGVKRQTIHNWLHSHGWDYVDGGWNKAPNRS